MSLIHRSAWYKIHGLNQDAADVVGNHKIRQPLPYALYVIVSAYDKQSPHAQAMALDILYRADNFRVSALFMQAFKRSSSKNSIPMAISQKPASFKSSSISSSKPTSYRA